MANEVVMSPVYRGLESAIHMTRGYPAGYFDREDEQEFALSALHAIREAVEDRVDAMITGRSDAVDLNALFEPTSVRLESDLWTEDEVADEARRRAELAGVASGGDSK